MTARQALVALLVVLLASSAWGQETPLGNAASSQSATLHGASLLPGSTIFSGDTLEVGSNGSAQVALLGGAQVEMGENSRVSLAVSDGRIQVVVESGLVWLRLGEQAQVEALVGDATIRSTGSLLAAGLIQVQSLESAIVAAEKGALLITTRESQHLVLRAGEAAELKFAQDKDEESGKNKGKRGNVIAIVVILGTYATFLGLMLGLHEPQLSNQGVVSPFRP